MHGNKILRSSIDLQKSAEAAVAHMKAGKEAPAGVLEKSPLSADPRPSWGRRLLSSAFQRILPLLRPIYYLYREFLTVPVLERLALMDARSASASQALLERVATIERALVAGLPHDGSLPASDDQVLKRFDRAGFFGGASVRRTVVNCGDGKVMIKCAVGYVMTSAADPALLICLIENGELEPGTRVIIERLVKPGTTFVDVGANIGLHTLAAARAMHGTGKVFAFEPFGPTRLLLSESVFINGFARTVEVHEAAVAAKTGSSVLYLGQTSGYHSLYPLDDAASADHQAVHVPLVALSDVIPLTERVDLIKIDVEGAELDVVRSAQPYIDANPDIAVIVEFGPSHLERTNCSPEDWFRVFADLGLVYRVIESRTGGLTDATLAELLALESNNLLFARPESPIWAQACAMN